MEPEILEGSFFIASIIPFWFAPPKIGDTILFDSNGKTIVKKIINFDDGKYFVEGENKLDDKKFPPIERSEILGKVVLKLT